LPTTRHRCNIDVWTLAQSRGDGHRSLVTPKRVLNEHNEDLMFLVYKNPSGTMPLSLSADAHHRAHKQHCPL